MKKLITQLGLGLALSAGAAVVPMVLTSPAIAQQIVSVSPSGEETINTSSVTWKFDNATLVDATSLKLFVDNVDVTSKSVIDLRSNTFGYKPSAPFTVGTHNVEVRFKNTRGISYKANWSFNILDVKLEMTAVYHNAAQGPLLTGDTFRAEIRGTTKAIAQLLLIQNGTTIKTLTPTETSPGVYQASFPVASGDRVNEGVVVARLEKSGKIIFRTVDIPFALNPSSAGDAGAVTQTVVTNPTATTPTNATQPLTLSITSPQNNSQLNAAGGFTLTGKTIPGATALISVQVDPPPASGLQVLGSILLGGSSTGKVTTVLNQEPVTVKADGTFEVVIPRTAGVSAGQIYRIAVRAQQGTETQTVNLTLKQQ